MNKSLTNEMIRGLTYTRDKIVGSKEERDVCLAAYLSLLAENIKELSNENQGLRDKTQKYERMTDRENILL